MPDHDPGHAPPFRSSDRTAQRPAVRRVIRDAVLRTLSHRERLLLILAFAEGLSDAEIAAVMGMSRDAAARERERITSGLRAAVAPHLALGQ
ncbi:MAG: helix-turn-helix domain-containing protein [Planctomycetota bacterium]|nr:helix-turn-helix domain-containing protein [Planctomycetota bacterium]